MYESMVEERAVQAQEVMLHPLLPRPVQLDVEKEALSALLDQWAIRNKGVFGFREPSPKKKREFLEKMHQLEHSPKKTPFMMILAATVENNNLMRENRMINKLQVKDMSAAISEFCETRRSSISIPSKEADILFSESFSKEKVIHFPTSFTRMDPVSLLKKDDETDVEIRAKEAKETTVKATEHSIDNIGEKVVQEPESVGRRAEVKERLRLLIEEDSQDTSKGNAAISSFTPSFDQEMMDGREKQDFRELVYELVRGVQVLKGDSEMGLCLQLCPERFGRMEIQLIIDDKKGIHIKFVVADQKAHVSILQGLNFLRDSLINAGVDVKRIEVELRDETKTKEVDFEKFHIREVSIADLAGRINLVA